MIYDVEDISLAEPMQTHIRSLLDKALKWAEIKSIPVHCVGVVKNALKCCKNIANKDEICIALIHCFGFSLEPVYQNEFAELVRKLSV